MCLAQNLDMLLLGGFLLLQTRLVMSVFLGQDLEEPCIKVTQETIECHGNIATIAMEISRRHICRIIQTLLWYVSEAESRYIQIRTGTQCCV